MATAAGCSSLALRARTHSASRAARLQADTNTASASSDTLGAAISMTIRAAATLHPPTRNRRRVRAVKARHAAPPLRTPDRADRNRRAESDHPRAAARTAALDWAYRVQLG